MKHSPAPSSVECRRRNRPLAVVFTARGRSSDLFGGEDGVGLEVTFLGVALGAGAEGRHFDDAVAEVDVHQAETPADDARVAEQAPHLVGRASVATSKSLGSRPSSRSRTLPPTRHDSKPDRSKR